MKPAGIKRQLAGLGGIIFFSSILAAKTPVQTKNAIPPEFVDVTTLNSQILVEARYIQSWNFIGSPVEGYKSSKCYLSKAAAQALANVQKDLTKEGLSLLVFDCYRPQKAVNHFVRWSKSPQDIKMKTIFYPEEPKETLFKRGYIASRSGHSRGSTVDLTLVRLPSGERANSFKEDVTDCRVTKGIEKTGQLDMGTTFDCFSELSHTENPEVSEKAQKNRQVLKTFMEKHGFKNYSKEWWHYTLANEPHKNKYFDFDVE